MAEQYTSISAIFDLRFDYMVRNLRHVLQDEKKDGRRVRCTRFKKPCQFVVKFGEHG